MAPQDELLGGMCTYIPYQECQATLLPVQPSANASGKQRFHQLGPCHPDGRPAWSSFAAAWRMSEQMEEYVCVCVCLSVALPVK